MLRGFISNPGLIIKRLSAQWLNLRLLSLCSLLLSALSGLWDKWMSPMLSFMGFSRKKYTWLSPKDMWMLNSLSMFAGFTSLFMTLNKHQELGLRALLFTFFTWASLLLMLILLYSSYIPPLSFSTYCYMWMILSSLGTTLLISPAWFLNFKALLS